MGQFKSIYKTQYTYLLDTNDDIDKGFRSKFKSLKRKHCTDNCSYPFIPNIYNQRRNVNNENS